MICRWNELPVIMQTEEVRIYYKILRKHKLSFIVKRTFDFVVSGVMLLLFLPIILILSVCICLDSPGPVFYCQERITQYGRLFRIYKFRTMIPNADKSGELITSHGDSRITKVGKKLRDFRLDEIPQLINILKGEMTFVGTRPEVEKYVNQYSNEMYATLLLPAGVTSKASIEFKDECRILGEKMKKGKSLDEAYLMDVLPRKMKWNLYMMKKFSLFGELTILIKTVKAVLN